MISKTLRLMKFQLHTVLLIHTYQNANSAVAGNSVVTVFLINIGIISPLLMIPFTPASPNSGLSAKLTSHYYIKKNYLTIFIKFL